MPSAAAPRLPGARALRSARARWRWPAAAAHGDAPLRFWAMGREGEVVGELLAEFEREHPGSRVRVEQLPWSAAHEKLLTAFAGDATPDIAQLGNTWIAEFAALGALEPLQPWLDADRSIVAADYFDGIWRTNDVEGTLYGVPWYVDTRLLFYRSDLFARAGVATMPDRLGRVRARARCAAARAASPHPLLLPLNEFEPLLALALQQDEPLLRDGGRYGNFRSAGFRRALALLHASASRAAMRRSTTGNEIANLWQEFGRGTFAAFISGPVEHRRARAPPAGGAARRAGPPRRCPARTARARRPPAARAW